MAKWLCEISQRGLGLRMCEFLDFVQSVVHKERRQVPFRNGRACKIKKDSQIIDQRVETIIELKRSQVTEEKLDAWYDRYRDFFY